MSERRDKAMDVIGVIGLLFAMVMMVVLFVCATIMIVKLTLEQLS